MKKIMLKRGILRVEQRESKNLANMGKITKQWLKHGSSRSFDLEICDIEIKREIGGDILNFKGSPQYVHHEIVIKAIRSDDTYQLIYLTHDDAEIIFQLINDAKEREAKLIEFKNNEEAG